MPDPSTGSPREAKLIRSAGAPSTAAVVEPKHCSTQRGRAGPERSGSWRIHGAAKVEMAVLKQVAGVAVVTDQQTALSQGGWKSSMSAARFGAATLRIMTIVRARAPRLNYPSIHDRQAARRHIGLRYVR